MLATLGGPRHAHAIAHGQTCVGSVASSTTVTCTWSGATSAGNLLVAVLTTGAGTAPTVTGDGGTWTNVAGASQDNGNLHLRVLYFPNASSRSGTVSWTLGTTSSATLLITEYNGMILTTPAVLDRAVSAKATSTTAASGSSTALSIADEVGVAAYAVLSSATSIGSASAGFTRVGSQTSTGGATTLNSALDEDIVVNSTTALGPSVTLGASTAWAAAIVTFQVSQNIYNGSFLHTTWSDTSSWSKGAVPTSNDTVIFSGTSNRNFTINQVPDVAGFYVRSGYTSTISNSAASMRVRGDFSQATGTFNAPSGTMRVDGGFNLSGGTFTPNAGTLLLASTVSKTHAFNGTTMGAVTVNDGLVAYYRLDDGSGTTAADSSGYGHTATLVSSPAWLSGSGTLPSAITYANTSALTFGGANNTTTASTSDLQIQNDLTIAFWVKRSADTADWSRLVGKGAAMNSRDYGVWLPAGSNPKLLFQQYNSGGTSVLDLNGNTSLALNTWYHVACTISGSTATIYVNGVVDSTVARGGIPIASTDALTMAYAGFHTYFQGSLDDVRIYKRALGATEISALGAGFAPMSGAATHTFSDALTAASDFSILSGTVSAGTNAVTVGGSWINRGGAFSGTGTITLNGSGTSLSLLSGGSHFPNMTVSGNGTWTLGDRVWIDGTYTQTTGTGTVTTATAAPLIASTYSRSAGTFSGTGAVIARATSAQSVRIDTSGAPVRIESPSETNLVGYWKMDNGRGTSVTDYSGNGYTGTVNGTPYWSSSGATATSFDNAGSYATYGSSYVSVPSNSNLQISGNITLSFWVYRTADTSDWVRLVGKGASLGSRDYGVWLPAGSNPKLLFQEYNSGGTSVLDLNGSTGLALNTWYHVACTISGSTATIYVNGVSDGTTTRSGTPITSTDAFTIGYAGYYNYFNGALDEVRVYNAALSSTQVASLAAGRYSGIGGGAIYSLSNAVAVTGDLTVDNGTLDVTASNYAVSVSGSLVNRGSITARSGTFTLNGSGAGNSLITNASHFNNLTFSSTGTWTMGDALNVDSTLTMSAASTLAQSSSNYAITAAIVNQTAGALSGGGSLILNASSGSNLALSNAAVSTVQIGAQSNSGLVGYWALDDGSGTNLTDSSGNGNSGTLHGSAAWFTSPLPSTQFTDTAGIYLNGSAGTYATLGVNNIPANNAAQTISLWCKYSTTAGNQNMITFVNPSGAGSAVQIGLRSGVLLAWKWGGTALASVTAPTDGGWHHLAYTFDGTTHKLYVDGVSGSTTTTAPQTASVTNAYLGTYDGASELYTGYLDDLRVYNRALSASEVSGLAAGSFYGSQTGSTYTLNGALSTSGDLTILGGGLDVSSTVYAMTVGGSFFNYGAFTARTGTVTFNGGSTGKTILSSKYHFNNLTISGTGTWTLGDRLWVDGALTMSSGTLSQSASNYAIRTGTVSQTGGTLTGSGTIAVQSRSANTVTLSSNAIKTVRLESTGETNLVGYWKADNGTGTSLTDYSGQGNTGTLNGNATWYTATLPSTAFDNYSALSLDGTNSYVTLGTTNIPANGSAQTVAFWAKFASSAGTQDFMALVTASSGLQIGLSGGNVRIWKFGGTDIMTKAAPTDGLWHHIAYTYDGTSTHSLYIDGGTATTSVVAAPTGAVTTAYLGTYAPNNEMYNGQLDDIRIYKAALTANQVAGLAAGRYSGVGGGAAFTLGASLNVPGSFALDNGTLDTGAYTLNAGTTDATQVSYVNAGQLTVGSNTLTFNGGLTVQLQATATEATAGGKIVTGTGKVVGFIETTGTMEGFPTASFNWNTFAYWREYVAYRAYSGTTDRLIARTADGAISYFWDLPSGKGSLLGTPRWNMETGSPPTVHYVYVITTLGFVYKLKDDGTAFTVDAAYPYRNGGTGAANTTATSPLSNDNSNLYWCGRDSSNNKKLFSLTLAGALTATPQTTANDVTAAPTVAAVSSVNYVFVGAQAGVYRAALDLSSVLSSTQPTTTVNGRLVVSNNNVVFPEDNGKIWALTTSALGTSWSYQDTDATRHPSGCSAASNCTVKNIYYDATGDRAIFGDADGHLYNLASGAIVTGYPWMPGTSADVFQTAPIERNGVILIGTTAGKLYEIDQNNGSGPALTRTYTLNAGVTSISYSASANGGTGAYTVGTAGGAIYYIVAGTDPTSASF